MFVRRTLPPHQCSVVQNPEEAAGSWYLLGLPVCRVSPDVNVTGFRLSLSEVSQTTPTPLTELPSFTRSRGKPSGEEMQRLPLAFVSPPHTMSPVFRLHCIEWSARHVYIYLHTK